MQHTASPFILAGIKRARVRAASNMRSKLSSLQKVLMMCTKEKRDSKLFRCLSHIYYELDLLCTCALHNRYCTGGRGSFGHVQIALYKKLISVGQA